MPASSWVRMKPPCYVFGAKNEVNSNRWTYLIVQLGVVTEPLNRQWFERNNGQTLKDVQRRIRHPVIRWMGATIDGVVAETGAVFEAKFMLPWSFSEEG